ncbi:MAG: methyltransferase [Actinomycetaceae bacterium]|nr:methyltransferase [Actinomycetaceae bacterium]
MNTPTTDPVLLAALRTDLRSTQFTVDAVNALLGERASSALLRNERVSALKAAREDDSILAVLTRLFVLWDFVASEDVAGALPNLGVDGLVSLGLVSVYEGELVRAGVQLQPHEAVINDAVHRWWIASDLGEGLTGRAPGRDHVLGIGGATRTLLQMTPREATGSVLDLGTGCGVLAMYAATHADRVVATDLSERAVAFARFNFALNELDIDLRLGSLFEPVAGERFDLIVSNPPFVITPDSLRGDGVVEYRDGGRRGDELVREVVAGAASHLSEGGRAVMLGNWEIDAAADGPESAPDWAAHPRTWVRESGLHAWVIQRERLDPAQYVEMWMRDNGARLAMTPSQYEDAYSRWLADFDQRGVAGIGLGVLTLQRPRKSKTNKPVAVFEEVVTTTTAPGDYVARTMTELFENPEIADPAVSDDVVFVRASDVREERHFEPGQSDPQVIIATQGGGFGRRIQLNTSMSAVLGASDGELTVGQIISALHILTEDDRADISARVYDQLAHLVRAGMLNRKVSA